MMCLLAPLRGGAGQGAVVNSPVSSKWCCCCSGSGDLAGAGSAAGLGHIPGALRGGVCVGTTGGDGDSWGWGPGGFFRVPSGKRGTESSSVVSPAREQDGRDVARVG